MIDFIVHQSGPEERGRMRRANVAVRVICSPATILFFNFDRRADWSLIICAYPLALSPTPLYCAPAPTCNLHSPLAFDRSIDLDPSTVSRTGGVVIPNLMERALDQRPSLFSPFQMGRFRLSHRSAHLLSSTKLQPQLRSSDYMLPSVEWDNHMRQDFFWLGAGWCWRR